MVRWIIVRHLIIRRIFSLRFLAALHQRLNKNARAIKKLIILETKTQKHSRLEFFFVSRWCHASRQVIICGISGIGDSGSGRVTHFVSKVFFLIATRLGTWYTWYIIEKWCQSSWSRSCKTQTVNPRKFFHGISNWFSLDDVNTNVNKYPASPFSL